MRALAAYGVFVEVDTRIGHSPAYGELAHAVRTGEAAATRVAPGGTFDYLAAHPEEGRLFDEAMTAKSHQQIAGVLGAYDFTGFDRIADIGGGRGHLLERVLAAAPRAKGVLFDLPHVVDALKPAASDRLTPQRGDFFKDPLPACDGYLMMSVIHDWGDAEATAILKAVRRAAPMDATLLLIEMLIPETSGPHPAKFLDIEMLVMTTGGRERTRVEYESLYATSGFRFEGVVATDTPTVSLQGSAA